MNNKQSKAPFTHCAGCGYFYDGICNRAEETLCQFASASEKPKEKAIIEQIRKEVAKEILQELFKEALNNRYGMVDFRQIKAHAKKYGVEVE